MRPMSFWFAFYVWMLFICRGVYLYNALYFGDAWLPKSKSLLRRALQTVFALSHSLPVWSLGPRVPTEKCIFLLFFCSAWRHCNLFWELMPFASLFLSSFLLKEEIHSKCSATGPWFVKMLFCSSAGTDAPGSFAAITPNVWPVVTCIVPQCTVDLGWAYLLSPNNKQKSDKGSCCFHYFDHLHYSYPQMAIQTGWSQYLL